MILLAVFIAGNGDSVSNQVEKGYFEKKIPTEGTNFIDRLTMAVS